MTTLTTPAPAGWKAPAWLLMPTLNLLNLLSAALCSAVVIWSVGANPLEAFGVLVRGAFGSGEAIGYTLYYTTNFIFTGLAVAIALHAGLFNIGADGQAYVAGLGVALVCLGLGSWPWWLVIPLSIAAALLFGAAWAFIPGWLQARRGSHVVVTTIMFNFIASALMNYLLVQVLIAPGQQSPETREFAPAAWLPFAHEIAAGIGITLPDSPLNISLVLAIVACVVFQLYVWRSPGGLDLRTVGVNEHAARYAGVPVARTVMLAMALSGALAGMVAVNDIQGVHHRLLVDFTGGVGFVGIAVALMGRNRPLGIVLAALLFGALAQGGTELSLDVPELSREMIVCVEGLIIFFCGALENLYRKPVARLLGRVD